MSDISNNQSSQNLYRIELQNKRQELQKIRIEDYIYILYSRTNNVKLHLDYFKKLKIDKNEKEKKINNKN